MKKTTGMVLLLCWGLMGTAAAAEDRLIVVNGVAEKGMDPNMVNFNIEVWSRAATAKQAQQGAAVQFKHAKKTFDEYKLKKEDIQTENYTLTPEYEYDQKTRQNRMVGFRVSQTLVATLRKVEDAGTFLDALVADRKSAESGINVQNLTWDSDKRSQVEVAALGEAVRAAKVKAEEIAKAAGVKVKSVARISHSTSGGGGGPRPMGMMMKANLESASTEVAAGQVKVRVEVLAEYEIN
ncbi:MAG: SIMPL domain-containing protein [Bdellovibrio sp.]